MPDDPRQALRARLDEPLPERLWMLPDLALADLALADLALADPALADLASVLADAHQRQSTAFDHSIDRALRFIPLWIVVRNVLIG